MPGWAGQPGGDPATPVHQNKPQLGLVPGCVRRERLKLLTQDGSFQAGPVAVEDPVGVIEHQHGGGTAVPQVRHQLLNGLGGGVAGIGAAYPGGLVPGQRRVGLYTGGHRVPHEADTAGGAVAVQECRQAL